MPASHDQDANVEVYSFLKEKSVRTSWERKKKVVGPEKQMSHADII